MRYIRQIFFIFLILFSFSEPAMSQDVFSSDQQTYFGRLEEENPKLYAYQKELFRIQGQLQEIVTKYNQKRISKARARMLLREILKELYTITNDIEYQVEQRVEDLLTHGVVPTD